MEPARSVFGPALPFPVTPRFPESRRASFAKVLQTQNRPQFTGGGCQFRLKDLSLKLVVESSFDALRHSGLQSGNRCQSVTNSASQFTASFDLASTQTS